MNFDKGRILSLCGERHEERAGVLRGAKRRGA